MHARLGRLAILLAAAAALLVPGTAAADAELLAEAADIEQHLGAITPTA